MKNTMVILLIAISSIFASGCAPVIVGGTAASMAAVHDRRTAGTVLDDQVIKASAAVELLRDPELKGTHIDVTSFNYVVLLTGEAQTNAQRARAEQIASNQQKVRQVHNEIAIAEPTSVMSRSNDALITARVKTRLVTIKGLEDFDLTRVKITTQNGVVYLMGLVTRKEADAVTEIARRLRGVKRVVRLFEYIS